MAQCFEVLNEYVCLADWGRPDGWYVDIAFVRTLASISIRECHDYLKENRCDIMPSFTNTYEFQTVLQNIATPPSLESWFAIVEEKIARICKGMDSRMTEMLPEGTLLLCTRSWETCNKPLSTGPFGGERKEYKTKDVT